MSLCVQRGKPKIACLVVHDLLPKLLLCVIICFITLLKLQSSKRDQLCVPVLRLVHVMGDSEESSVPTADEVYAAFDAQAAAGSQLKPRARKKKRRRGKRKRCQVTDDDSSWEHMAEQVKPVKPADEAADVDDESAEPVETPTSSGNTYIIYSERLALATGPSFWI